MVSDSSLVRSLVRLEVELLRRLGFDRRRASMTRMLAAVHVEEESLVPLRNVGEVPAE